MEMSVHDGSLNPIRNDVAHAHRRITNEKNRRKLLRKDVEALSKQVEAIMDYLDGAHRIGHKGMFLNFSKTSVIMSSEEETDEET